MQLYQFENIYTQMKREFGSIEKGTENAYTMVFFPMEGNALKIHRAFPKANGRRLKEAIALVLFDIKEKYTGETFSTEKFRDENNEKLEKALLMAFDPYTNEEVMEALRQEYKTSELSTDQLKDYYKIPVICLLRLKESVDTWEKQAGPDGYFRFIEQQIGGMVKGDEMHYSVLKKKTFGE